MENVLTYRNIIERVLQEVMGSKEQREGERFHRVVSDTKNDVYLYMAYGWQGQDHVHAVYVHLDIIDGKVWAQRNYTEYDVPKMLLEAGIPAEDIVLGGVAPYMREATPFARG